MAQSGDPIEQIREKMDVYGVDGEKIGHVGEVYYGMSAGGVSSGITEPGERSYFEVKRGILGLGKDMWFSTEAVQEVDSERIVLRWPKSEANSRAMTTPPSRPDTAGESL